MPENNTLGEVVAGVESNRNNVCNLGNITRNEISTLSHGVPSNPPLSPLEHQISDEPELPPSYEDIEKHVVGNPYPLNNPNENDILPPKYEDVLKP